MFLKYSRETITTKPRFEVTKEIATSSRIRASSEKTSVSLLVENRGDNTLLTPRGPGLWKFNNTLLNDEQYIALIRSTYAEARTYYSKLEDKRLVWEMIKMEIRSATISYAKHKVKASYLREKEIERQLDHLDSIICNNFFLLILIVCYKSTKTSKQNCDQFTRIEENRLCFGQSVAG